ncbi:MAG: trehalose-phosphatase [Acidimicrobiia bacterium]
MSDAVALLRADPARTALLLDFDGTLAPIVDDPAAARPLPGAAAVLADLSDRYGVVAVVSGRPVAFLTAHLPPGLVLSGLYGMELRRGVEVESLGGAAWRPVVAEVAADARASGPAGALVEPKDLSLTLHYRTRPELEPAVLAWARAAAQRSGLELRRARMSVELHPPGALDKGTAVAGLLDGMAVACFVGDDVGDLRAFDALDRFAATGGRSVRVVVRSPETAPALRARADLLVDGPEGVLGLLSSL